MGKADLPRPLLSSGMTGTPIPWLKKKVKVGAASISAPAPEILPLLPTEDAPSTIAEGVGKMPPPPSSSSLATSLPDLVKKFRHIKTKLQSSSPLFESPLL